ncbi:hypothetical protein SAMN02745127_02813 [Oceanospirillum multiglobuliferum]|uniref:PsbP C-terminal domain-containing protein n=1 Tax=Oceanospirillum multiglobuliferum TaxID=64969 RepID=A0A1T4S7P8_9GAMM|nr:hypothetical protein [Oceanospirillum multiglobuliferum]OPX54406.1 hypothetical protein BTE48_14335 [Oceanospirillum multiglobuliferum]SKA24177.1 hypothetical protein SAMN02745127_02813 [Oceanospirillum multiglobuliferum]
MRSILALLIVLYSISAQADPVKFDKYGFSIDMLDGNAGNAGAQVLQMYLPADNGFASNVNVLIQPYPGTLEDYKKLSDAQFAQLGLTIITSTISDGVLIFEYKGVVQGQNLHFYSKAIKNGNNFYLATATDSASNWSKNKGLLMKSVNSFKVP